MVLIFIQHCHSKVNALGSWNEGSLNWNLATVEVEGEFEHFDSAFGYGVPGVGVPEIKTCQVCKRTFSFGIGN